jgi:flagellar basal body-associated protein FliL
VNRRYSIEERLPTAAADPRRPRVTIVWIIIVIILVLLVIGLARRVL